MPSGRNERFYRYLFYFILFLYYFFLLLFVFYITFLFERKQRKFRILYCILFSSFLTSKDADPARTAAREFYEETGRLCRTNIGHALRGEGAQVPSPPPPLRSVFYDHFFNFIFVDISFILVCYFYFCSFTSSLVVQIENSQSFYI